MTLEKILVTLLSLMTLVIIVLVIKLIKQGKATNRIKLDRDTIINLFEALYGYQPNGLSLDLINKTPESYLRYFGISIKIYYQDLIKTLSFVKLADLIHELENSITDFQKKRQLMRHFSKAAENINSDHWARLLMDSIMLAPMEFEKDHQKHQTKALRLEDFIIATVISSKQLFQLESDFQNEVTKLCGMAENFRGTQEVEAAGIILEKIRQASK